MDRYYYTNLVFSEEQDHLLDTEQGDWHYYKDGKEIEYNDNYFQFYENTMCIYQDGCYIQNHTNINMDDWRKCSLYFKFKINYNYYEQAVYAKKPIYSLSWKRGSINILEYKDEEPFIVLDYDNKKYYISFDYNRNNDWNSVLLTCNNSKFTIYINGIKRIERLSCIPSFNFNNMKLGNYIRSSVPNYIGPMVEYKELVLVNDILYPNEFDIPTEELHYLFPEVEVEEQPKFPRPKKFIIQAPYIYSSKDSINDHLHNMEITRRADYTVDKKSILTQQSKYKFDEDEYKKRGDRRMAFNREDLITWNELAPSLQTILRALQTSITRDSQRINQILDRIEGLPLENEIHGIITSYINDHILPNLADAPVIAAHTHRLNKLEEDLEYHINSTDPHPNYVEKASFLIHNTNTEYKEGDTVFVKGLPINIALECVEAGTTNLSKPDFAAYYEMIKNG